jgi:hypothetical protein
MPVTRIAIHEGKPAAYKQALLDEIYAAMRETVAIKDGDRFMAITEHGDHEFAYGAFLTNRRPDARSGPRGTGQSCTRRPCSAS